MRTATFVIAAALAASMSFTAQAAPVNPTAGPPRLSEVSPAAGGPGDVIEILGEGFVENGRPATVTFLSVPGKVEEFSDTRLSVEVPVVQNPPDGFIELRITTSLGSDVAPFRYYAGQPGELSAPTVLDGKASKGKVRLRWGVPKTGADKVTAYEWRFQLKGKAWSKWKKVAKGAKARKQVVKKIRPKKMYVFEVRAMAGTTAGPSASVELKGK